MSFWSRLFGGADEPVPKASDNTLTPPAPREPADADERRLHSFARRVASELTAAAVPPSRQGGNHWVVSYDVHEAVWFLVRSGTWADRAGHSRDGRSQGACLLLFRDGRLGQGEWFGELNPLGESVGISDVAPLTGPDWRWSGGNLGSWKAGGGGLHPEAREHFRGLWPAPRKTLGPWAGTSMQLKRLLTEKRSQVPRYFA